MKVWHQSTCWHVLPEFASTVHARSHVNLRVVGEGYCGCTHVWAGMTVMSSENTCHWVCWGLTQSLCACQAHAAPVLLYQKVLTDDLAFISMLINQFLNKSNHEEIAMNSQCLNEHCQWNGTLFETQFGNIGQAVFEFLLFWAVVVFRTSLLHTLESLG